jgi:hypothetical protein
LPFSLSLSFCASGNVWTQTLDLKMLKKLFYHCATTVEQVLLDYYLQLSPTSFTGLS